jgi:hypothetical protein
MLTTFEPEIDVNVEDIDEKPKRLKTFTPETVTKKSFLKSFVPETRAQTKPSPELKEDVNVPAFGMPNREAPKQPIKAEKLVSLEEDRDKSTVSDIYGKVFTNQAGKKRIELAPVYAVEKEPDQVVAGPIEGQPDKRAILPGKEHPARKPVEVKPDFEKRLQGAANLQRAIVASATQLKERQKGLDATSQESVDSFNKEVRTHNARIKALQDIIDNDDFKKEYEGYVTGNTKITPEQSRLMQAREIPQAPSYEAEFARDAQKRPMSYGEYGGKPRPIPLEEVPRLVTQANKLAFTQQPIAHAGKKLAETVRDLPKSIAAIDRMAKGFGTKEDFNDAVGLATAPFEIALGGLMSGTGVGAAYTVGGEVLKEVSPKASQRVERGLAPVETYAQEHPESFAAKIPSSVRKLHDLSFQYLVFGAGHRLFEYLSSPEAVKPDILKNAKDNLARTVAERYTGRQLKDIYTRVSSQGKFTPQEEALVRTINDAFGSGKAPMKEVFRRGIEIGKELDYTPLEVMAARYENMKPTQEMVRDILRTKVEEKSFIEIPDILREVAKDSPVSAKLIEGKLGRGEELSKGESILYKKAEAKLKQLPAKKASFYVDEKGEATRSIPSPSKFPETKEEYDTRIADSKRRIKDVKSIDEVEGTTEAEILGDKLEHQPDKIVEMWDEYLKEQEIIDKEQERVNALLKTNKKQYYKEMGVLSPRQFKNQMRQEVISVALGYKKEGVAPPETLKPKVDALRKPAATPPEGEAATPVDQSQPTQPTKPVVDLDAVKPKPARKPAGRNFDPQVHPLLAQMGAVKPSYHIDKTSGKVVMDEEYENFPRNILDLSSKPTVQELQLKNGKSEGTLDLEAQEMGFEDSESFREALLKEVESYRKHGRTGLPKDPEVPDELVEATKKEVEGLKGKEREQNFVELFNQATFPAQSQYVKEKKHKYLSVQLLEEGDVVNINGTNFTVEAADNADHVFNLVGDYVVPVAGGDALPVKYIYRNEKLLDIEAEKKKYTSPDKDIPFEPSARYGKKQTVGERQELTDRLRTLLDEKRTIQQQYDFASSKPEDQNAGKQLVAWEGRYGRGGQEVMQRTYGELKYLLGRQLTSVSVEINKIKKELEKGERQMPHEQPRFLESGSEYGKGKQPYEMTADEWLNNSRFYYSGKTRQVELPTGEKVIVGEGATAKTFKQLHRDFLLRTHKAIIENRLKNGESITPEVLKDYPDLQEKYGLAEKMKDKDLLPHEYLVEKWERIRKSLIVRSEAETFKTYAPDSVPILNKTRVAFEKLLDKAIAEKNIYKYHTELQRLNSENYEAYKVADAMVGVVNNNLGRAEKPDLTKPEKDVTLPHGQEEAPQISDTGLQDILPATGTEQLQRKAETAEERYVRENLKKGEVEPARQREQAVRKQRAEAVKQEKRQDLSKAIDRREQLLRESKSGLQTSEQHAKALQELAQTNRSIGKLKDDLGELGDELFKSDQEDMFLGETFAEYVRSKGVRVVENKSESNPLKKFAAVDKDGFQIGQGKTAGEAAKKAAETLKAMQDNKSQQPQLDFDNAKTAETKDGIVFQSAKVAGVKLANTEGLPVSRRPLKEGEFELVQRRYAKSTVLKLYGGELSGRTSDEIASIFRPLEDAAIEHSAVHLLRPDGKKHVLYIAQGNYTAVMFDPRLILDMVNRFGATEVTLVHNHPSQVTEELMSPSSDDISMHRKLKNALPKGVKLNDSILIDKKKGLYATFNNLTGMADVNKRAVEKIGYGTIQGKEPVKVLSFSREVLLGDINDLKPLHDASDVAKITNIVKVGGTEKLSLLVRNNSGYVTRLFILDETLTDLVKHPEKIRGVADDLAVIISKSGGTNGVLAGNIAAFNNPAFVKVLTDLTGRMHELEYPIFDYVGVEPNKDLLPNYKSAQEMGLLREPPSAYGEKELREPQGKEEITKSPEFKKWFGNSKVVDESGKPKIVYSGHSNVAMYGEKFEPRKGTAGGFFATENPALASNYSTGKFGGKEYFEGGSQYRLEGKNGKFNKRLWQIELSPEQKAKLDALTKEKDEYGDSLVRGVNDMMYWAKNNKDYDPVARRLLFQPYNLQNIHDYMEQMGYTISYADKTEGLSPVEAQTQNDFEDLLDRLGIKWNSYDKLQPGVLPLYLNVKNPIDTQKPFPVDLLQALKNASKYERNTDWQTQQRTQWTKDYPLKQWVKDIEEGDEYWATHIPSKAVPIMKSFGYDGIKDWGNKSSKVPITERPVTWIAFDPTQIKSATGNIGTFDPNDPNILREPPAKYGKQELAPIFYSNTQRLIEQKMPNKASVEQVRNILSQGKQEEIKWTGLDDFLKTKPSFTKQEILDYLKANEVKVEEVEKSNTKFSQYVLPGAKEGTYRELLLTLPTTRRPLTEIELKERLSLGLRGNLSAEQMKRYNELSRIDLDPATDYRSPHFDEPNVLAHIRFNERTTADGKRTLFIEELQSDWAADARRYGAGEQSVKNVPEAPFIKNDGWKKLAIRKMIRYAAENGYDSISWTTGEQQKQRYDLSRQVEKIRAEKMTTGTKVGQFSVNATEKGGREQFLGMFTEDRLADVVGKDLAKKIIDEAPKNPDGKDYSGLDLKVGGEGLKNLYDRDFVNIANDLGKKFGSKVETVELFEREGKDNQGFPSFHNVHSLSITPSMKQSVLYEGQQLFEPSAEYAKKKDNENPIGPNKAQNDYYVMNLLAQLEAEKKPRLPQKRGTPVISLMKDALPIFYLEAVAKNLKRKEGVEYIRGKLVEMLENDETIKNLSPGKKITALHRLQTENVDRWVRFFEKDQRKRDIVAEAKDRNAQIAFETADRLLAHSLTEPVIKELLAKAQKYRVNSDNQKKFFAGFLSRISNMAKSYGQGGGRLTLKLYDGDLKRGEMFEYGNQFLSKVRDIWYDIESPFERERVAEAVIDALQHRVKPESYIDTDIKKELSANTLKILDYFRDRMKAAGYDTIDDYFPHMRQVDIIEQIMDALPEEELKAKKGLDEIISEKSPFLKPREDARIEIRKDLPNVLLNYIKSVSKELAYRDAVQYYREQFLYDMPIALRNNSLDRARAALKASLNPERSRGSFYRVANFIRGQNYRNFLGMNLKASVQNLTQLDFAKLRWSKEADALRFKMWLKRETLTGALADAVDMASADTPRFLELTTSDEYIKRTGLSEYFNRIDTFQKAEGRNWGQAELGSILNSVMKDSRYQKALKDAGGDQIQAISKLLENKDIFDKAVTEAAVTSAETQVAVAPSMRGEFYDQPLHRLQGMFTAFKFRQLQVLAEALGKQEGINGTRAQMILRRGMSGEIESVEVLREVEGNRVALEKFLDSAKKHNENIGVRYEALQDYIDYVKKQERELNDIIKQIEPLAGSKARTARLVAKYYLKVVSISVAFSLLYDTLDNAIFGEDDNEKNIIARMIKAAALDMLTVGTNPAKFLVSPVAPNLEHAYQYGKFSGRGLARDVVSYGLNALPFAGLIDRTTGKRISKAIIDVASPPKKKSASSPVERQERIKEPLE